LIEEAISFLKEETPIPTTVYENLISIYETIIFEDDKYLSEDKYGHLVSRESDYIRQDKIMEWHRKLKELDPTHIIPIDE